MYDVGLYRDDLLTAILGSKNAIESLRKSIVALFKELNLKIDAETVMAKRVDYLDVALDLEQDC